MQCSALVYLAGNTFANSLPYGRDTNHDGQLESMYITEAVAHGSISQSLDIPIPSSHAIEGEGYFHHKFEDVGEGEEHGKVI